MAWPVLWSEEGLREAFKDDEVGAGHPRMNSWSARQAVDRKGNVVARFEPTADMKDVRAFVEKLVKEG